MKRNVSIDILKILSMILVIVHHATQYGVTHDSVNIAYENIGICIFVLVTRAFSLLAVNCFVLISGYFMSGRQANYNKLFKLWGQAAFYSVLIYLVVCGFRPELFGFKGLLEHCLPILTNQYWFFTDYFLLFLLIPVLNVFVNAATKEEYQKGLLVVLTVLCVIPSIDIFGDISGAKNGYSLIWFCALFLVGAYIKKFPQTFKFGGWIFPLSMVAIIAVRLGSRLVFEDRSIGGKLISLLMPYNSVLVFAGSVGLFILFVNNKITLSTNLEKFFSKVASLSFAVYLIHEHNMFRDILWDEIVGLYRFKNSPLKFIAVFLLAIVSIFVISIVVEYIRQLICKVLDKIGIGSMIKKK